MLLLEKRKNCYRLFSFFSFSYCTHFDYSISCLKKQETSTSSWFETKLKLNETMEDMPNSQPEQTSKRSRTADARSIRSQSQSFNEQKLRSPRPRSLNRSNKLYRTPRTPPPEIQFDREQSFILDCKAVSNISNDYSTANPKLGSVIPPYDSQLDPHTQSYYQFFGVPRTLARAGQVEKTLFREKN